MANDADPYRTLGLARGATPADVKKAYRRLAKANHPDAAGEAALPRFLAIQAAYDQIMGPGAAAGGSGRPTAARRPWDAEPDRADATHRAYGGRARRTRTSGPRRPAGPGNGSAGSSRGGPPPDGAQSPGGSGRSRPPNKATLGSTSYDGAEAEPFEPDWGGASWYGTTSGTYWTLNPKEYADPRKHGPEYQARARRAAAAAAGADAPLPGEEPPGPADPAEAPPVADAGPDADAASAEPAATPPPPTHTTSSWWDATTGPASAEPGAAAGSPTSTPGPTPAGPRYDAPSRRDHAEPSSSPAATPSTTAASSASAAAWAWLEGGGPTWPVRIGRAILGWIPLALAIGWAGGELTGCARFSADCDGSTSAVLWSLQVGALALVVLVPWLATLAATAAIAAIGIAVPAALILSAPGSEGATSASTTALAIVIAGAWAVGLAVGVWRAVRRTAEPLS